ncbi:MAG TPA: metallophosphoesterase [Chloroflexota bacterium]|nr:metallophosphoesterase [Chloroflexota bacterium]
MLIGFLGDVHGQVFHALAVVATCQAEMGERFDLVVQVGDLGAYPDPDPARMDEAGRRYLQADPSQADFSRLLRATGRRTESLRRLRARLVAPVHFLRGNHEDFAWLNGLPRDPVSGTAPVDPFDLFRYVPDGAVLKAGAWRIAFLGGAEEGGDTEAGIDPVAVESLAARGAGAFEVLVTHDAPHGVGVGFYGQTQGARAVTRLIETVQPAFHVAGHLALIGPQRFGGTTSLVLEGLSSSPLWNPSPYLQVGCLAVLDTTAGTLEPVLDDWLARFPQRFDFDAFADAL